MQPHHHGSLPLSGRQGLRPSHHACRGVGGPGGGWRLRVLPALWLPGHSRGLAGTGGRAAAGCCAPHAASTRSRPRLLHWAVGVLVRAREALSCQPAACSLATRTIYGVLLTAPPRLPSWPLPRQMCEQLAARKLNVAGWRISASQLHGPSGKPNVQPAAIPAFVQAHAECICAAASVQLLGRLAYCLLGVTLFGTSWRA